MQISPCIMHRLSAHCCGVHFCNQINHNEFLFFQMITLWLLFVNTQNEMHWRVTELSAKGKCFLCGVRFRRFSLFDFSGYYNPYPCKCGRQQHSCKKCRWAVGLFAVEHKINQHPAIKMNKIYTRAQFSHNRVCLWIGQIDRYNHAEKRRNGKGR